MKSARFIFAAAFVALILVLAFKLQSRLHASQALAESVAASNPTVTYVVADLASAPSSVVLPAAIHAFEDTPLYARTTGFIAQWSADIGDHVKAGQVLARIDGPDLDQELNQAKAALEQAKASLEIARISAERWKDLGSQNAVAQQDVDQKNADFLGAKANVVAAQANVERLSQLKDFQQIVAPYDAVVTARNAQIGALINAGSGTEIYHIAQTDPLRVYVGVPQTYVRSLKEGLEVDITVPEFPGRSFKGTVARFAGALDGATRTLQTEIRVPNAKSELMPGMFGEAHFSFKAAAPAILLPATAAIVNASGTLVATLDADNRVHLVPVKLGRDFGSRIEVLSGLSPGTRVVSTPRDSLLEGMTVNPVPMEAKEKR